MEFYIPSFILLVLSASALPALAILAILLRKNLFSGKSKYFFLSLGILFLFFSIKESVSEHGGRLGLLDILTAIIFSLITFFILSKYNHTHKHKKETDGAKGIAISEAFHSLTDGAVIGATYVINPIIGYAATIGIIVHELPKVVGTLAIFRSLGLSIKQTIIYGIFAQIGSPLAAIVVYMIGKNVSEESLHPLEIASLASLTTIIVWIIWLEIKFHLDNDNKHTHNHDNHKHNH